MIDRPDVELASRVPFVWRTAARDVAGRRGLARAGRERGSVLLEFALVVPLLLVLVFGVIDFGNVYNDYQSVREGAGDGLRKLVVTQTPTASSPHCNGSDDSNIHMSSGAATAGSAAADLICYVKARVGLNMDNTRVKIVFNPPFTAGNPVMVCVQYPASSITGVMAPLLNGRALTTRDETSIEYLAPAAPDSSLAAGTIEEDPITQWPSACDASAL